MTSNWVRPMVARSCFRRGEAEARIVRRPRRRLSAGRSKGGGGRILGAADEAGFVGLASYDGGGSEDIRAFLMSDILRIHVL